MSRLAALTGGAGFLGRHVLAALRDRDWRLRMLVRSQPDLPELAGTEIDFVPGDMTDASARRRLVSGADAIIHIAGLVKAQGRDAFMRANRDGVADMAETWRAVAPEARFLLVSSMAARAPKLSAYAESKRAGEKRLAEIGDGHDWLIARPGAIYGAHDRESLKVLKLANGPVQIALNAADARVAMIDARDAAAGVAAMLERGRAGAVHELTDARADGYAWREVIEAAAAALGRTPRMVRLPAPVLRLAGAAGDATAAVTGAAPMLSSGKAREILHRDWSADPRLAPDPALWRPNIDMARGFADMVAWARGAGAL